MKVTTRGVSSSYVQEVKRTTTDEPGSPPRRHERSRRAGTLSLLAIFAGLLLQLSGVAPSAQADSASSGGDVSVAQSFDGRELTVVLRRLTSVPGPMRVDITTHRGTAPGEIRLTVTPNGASRDAGSPPAGAATEQVSVHLGATPGTYSATVPIDRAGPWQLTLDDGRQTAQIPFVAHAQVTSPAEYAVYVGIVGAGLMIIVTAVLAMTARRSWWVWIPGCWITAGIAVAVTGALLSASQPLPPQPGLSVDATVDNVTDPYGVTGPRTLDHSRSPLMLSIADPQPVAGHVTPLTLSLWDSATGVLADDLVVHDGAFIHLLIVGPDGTLWHLHPVRLADGRYQVQASWPSAGHYAVSAELGRRGGGVQLVRAAAGVDVLPAAGARGAQGTGEVAAQARHSAPVPARLSTARPAVDLTVNRAQVKVTATGLVAGSPSTLTARIGHDNDLQLWLGMVGHLVVAGPLASSGQGSIGAAVQRAPVWSHGHSMGAMPETADPPSSQKMPSSSHPGAASGMGRGGMAGIPPTNGDSAPDETVAAFGPDVPFTYTFPSPGRYRVWIQAQRDYTVLTVPLEVTVQAGAHR